MDAVRVGDERRLKWVLPAPSLQHLALVKIGTAMWGNDNIVSTQLFPTAYFNPPSGTKLIDMDKAIEGNVEAKVLALPLPDPLKNQLVNLIKPLRLEILAWLDYHYEEYKYCNDFPFVKHLLPEQFYWSMHGTVDYKKTAQVMLKDGRFDVKSRYEVACANCLEDEAREMFRALDEEQRSAYLSINMDENDLISFFTRSLGTPWLDDGGFENILPFLRALHSGNRVRCQYFYGKWSSQEEKEMYLEESLRLVDDGYALFRNVNAIYLLSLMNADTLEQVFRNFTADLLECFLRWPMQPLFVEAVQYGCTFMNATDNGKVLRNIVQKIIRGFRDYNYCQLFFECWRLNPAESKRRFLDDTYSLESLIETRREKFVRLVFEEAPARHVEALCNRFLEIKEVLLDESVICDAALEELKKETELNSSEDQADDEKRARNRNLRRLLNMVIASRIKKQFERQLRN